MRQLARGGTNPPQRSLRELELRDRREVEEQWRDDSVTVDSDPHGRNGPRVSGRPWGGHGVVRLPVEKADVRLDAHREG